MKAAWWVIARRELLERIRSRWFVIATIAGPLMLVGAMAVPVLIAQENATLGARVVIADDRSGVGQALGDNLGALGWQVSHAAPETADATLLEAIAEDRIDGFLRLPPDLVGGQGRVLYLGDNASNQTAMAVLADALSRALTAVRLSSHGLAPPAIHAALRPPAFETRHTTGEAEGTSGPLVFALAYVIVILLYMAIVIYAVNVMRAIVVEKTNKVVEVLLGATTAEAMMLGKIAGVGLAGLIQVAVWTLALVVLSSVGLGALGPSTMALPSVDPVTLVVIIAYFLLGYFFFAAVYAAIGAMVASEQEAQQAQAPVVLVLIIPIACIQLVANDPRGDAAELLTQIPLTSPFLMPMRHLLHGASFGSLAASLAILVASTWFVSYLAARIFRVGILMTGKRPSLRELWRWMRHR